MIISIPQGIPSGPMAIGRKVVGDRSLGVRSSTLVPGDWEQRLPPLPVNGAPRACHQPGGDEADVPPGVQFRGFAELEV